MSDFPAWLESDQDPGGGGMWPLGLEAQGFRLVGRTLYGLTGNTEDIRYYSFLSWVFWTFKEACDREEVRRSPAAQTAWRDRLEMIFRIASLHHEPEILGLIGKTQIGRPVPNEDGMLSLDVGRAVTTAFKAASYSASFEKLGCGRILPNRLVQLSAEIGVPLARAYDEQLRAEASDEDMAWILSTGPEIPAEVVYRLAGAMSLRFVEPGEPEHPVLTDLLFRLRPAGDPALSLMDTARSRSLTLFLEIVEQARGSITGHEPMHAVLATRSLPDGEPLDVPSELEETFLRWERYQERQFEKIAIYGLWSVLVDLLRLGLAHPDRMTAALREAIRDAAASRESFPEAPLTVSVREAVATVLARATTSGDPPGEAQLRLVARIRDGSTPWTERASASLALLLLTTGAWRQARDRLSPTLCKLHEEGGRERLCLAEVTRDVERHGNDPLGSFAGWALGTYVLAQANHTALIKLVQQGQYQFFVAQDESGYRLVKDISPLDYVAYDKPHIDQALWMLAGLHLVDRSAEAVAITPEGGRLLVEAKAYHRRSQDAAVRAA